MANENNNSLTDDAKIFIIIPEDIICDLTNKCIVAYVYFWLWAGKNNKTIYTIEHLVSWCGYTPDNKSGRSNSQFKDVIDYLENIGYITCQNQDDLKKPYTALLVADLHLDWYKKNVSRFAKLYLDEINKIMDYDCGKKSKSLTNSNILMVFAYLRLMIPIRNSIEGEDKEKREYSPEVFYSYYKDICEDLRINEKTLSSILRILSKDLGLIYMQRVKRKKFENKNGTNKWLTSPTFFCNTYKRLKGKLIYSGSEYYEYEIKNKIKKTNFKKLNKVNTKVEDSETDVDTKWLDEL